MSLACQEGAVRDSRHTHSQLPPEAGGRGWRGEGLCCPAPRSGRALFLLAQPAQVPLGWPVTSLLGGQWPFLF